MSEFVRVAHLHEIPRERGKAITVQGRDIALFNVSGKIYAIDGTCPHEGGPLAGGPIQNGIVTCPWHLWRFDVQTGAFTEDPSIRVGCFEVRIEGQDVLIDISSLTGPLRRDREIFERFASGQDRESLSRAYGITPQEVDRVVRRIRIGDRLVWLGELFERQGALHGQDLLRLPYRELKGISYGVALKFDELIELL